MEYKDFGDITEEKILQTYPKVIDDVKSEFKLLENSNVQDIHDDFSSVDEVNTQSRGISRVLTDNNNHNYVPREERMPETTNNIPNDFGGFSSDINSDIRQNNGASYVVIVAAIIALIIIVYVVSSTILKMVDFNLLLG